MIIMSWTLTIIHGGDGKLVNIQTNPLYGLLNEYSDNKSIVWATVS